MGETIPFPDAEVPKRRKLTTAQVKELEQVYKKSERQLRRWWKEGAPLDRPEEMPAWWAKGHSHSCPAEILIAAHEARGNATVEPSTDPIKETSVEPLVVGSFTLEEGEEVPQLRRLVAVAYSRLEAAYAGKGGDVDMLQGRYNKACEALRKFQATDRAEAKQRGLLIPRADVDSDIGTACQLLRQMRESMVRRVLEKCPSLDASQREEVASAIISVRENEDRIFQDIKSLKTPADVAQRINS